MRDLVTTLRSGKVLVMDGAMGTEVMRLAQTAAPLDYSEAHNLVNASLVQSIHQSYLAAGADVLLTNTFQANPVALARHGDEFHLRRIWHEAIRLARAEDGPPHFVLADI